MVALDAVVRILGRVVERASGEFVDHARERSAGPVNTDLERAIERVRERLAVLREADDKAFATAYAAWLSSGSASSSTG